MSRSLLKQIRSDLRTYNGRWSEQGFWALTVYRFGGWRYGVKPALLRKIFSLIYKISFKFIEILTGITIPSEAKLGNHIRIDHYGGVIVSGYAEIGDHCVIRQGVTIGLKNTENPCAPKIGKHVDIGAGAKLLGAITIGDHVKVGANAVVLCDVPSGSTVVGVPARILEREA